VSPRLAAVGADVARSALYLDRSKLAVDVGLRCAVGLAIPLVAGQASGHPLVGAVAATGALTAGLVSQQGTYRSRAGVVLAASLVFALCAFIGGTLGHLVGADIALAAGLGFLVGLAACLGPAATAIGLQAIVGLVVFSQFSFPATVALREAAFVFAGGAVQMLLIVVLWPVSRFSAERRALSQAFDSLALYSRDVAAGSVGLADPTSLDAVSTVLRDPQPFGGREERAAFQALGDQAGRVRLELAAIVRVRVQLIDAEQFGAAAAVEDVLRTTYYVFSEIASAVREGRVPTNWADERDQFEAGIERLEDMQSTGWTGAIVSEAVRRSQAIAGQLRTIVRLAAIPAGGDPDLLEEAALTGRPLPDRASTPPLVDTARIRERLATLRANLALSSEACRHGMRLAAALAVAVALSQLFALQHRYWLPLTVVIVLRPDFSSTFTRGLSRVVGTLAGAGLVTLILAELRPGPTGLTILAVLFCFGATTTLLANYAIYSVCIASLVVTLLAFNGAPDASVAASRSFYTVLGAVVALIAYLVWPTWAATSLPDRLADLVDTEGRYGSEVLAAWSDPAGAKRSELERARLTARLTRSNTEALVDRWLSEPARGDRLDQHLVLGVVAAVRNCVQGILSLHAQIPAQGRSRPELAGPELARQELAGRELQRLASEFDAAMGVVAAKLRTGSDGSLPPLRSTQLQLARRLGIDGPGGEATGTVDPRVVVLIGGTDLMVNSANTLGHLVDVSGP
jgi:uncharacterized membrane protein YccC